MRRIEKFIFVERKRKEQAGGKGRLSKQCKNRAPLSKKGCMGGEGGAGSDFV